MLNLFQHPSRRSAGRSRRWTLKRVQGDGKDPITGRGDGTSSGRRSVVTARIVVDAEEMERDIGFVADHPAVMPRRNGENVARTHLDDPAIVHRRRRTAGDDHSDMRDLAGRFAQRSADVRRPFPAGIVGRPADPSFRRCGPARTVPSRTRGFRPVARNASRRRRRPSQSNRLETLLSSAIRRMASASSGAMVRRRILLSFGSASPVQIEIGDDELAQFRLRHSRRGAARKHAMSAVSENFVRSLLA